MELPATSGLNVTTAQNGGAAASASPTTMPSPESVAERYLEALPLAAEARAALVRDAGIAAGDDDAAALAKLHRALAKLDPVLRALLRASAAERLGFSYAAVAARNPRIVYASIAAFGQSGPLMMRPAHDIGMEALAGVLSLNLDHSGRPVHPHMPIADITGSMMALAGVLMALLRREDRKSVV